jgi:hypothetical protein
MKNTINFIKVAKREDYKEIYNLTNKAFSWKNSIEDIMADTNSPCYLLRVDLVEKSISILDSTMACSCACSSKTPLSVEEFNDLLIKGIIVLG